MPDRSIRNIPVSNRRAPLQGQGFNRTPLQEEYERGYENFRMPPRPPSRARFWLWTIFVIIACIALGAGAAWYFAGATVTVQPRTASVAPAAPISATLESQNAAPAGTLGFQTVTASASTSRAVPASGTEAVNTYAQGTITIYNKHSTAPQTLVATTRFETADGKIYRIHQTIVVPGEKKQADGTVMPGSINATAYADLPGPSGNIGAAQFSVPGFKGKPLYNDFYATTDGMSGGTSGMQPVVRSADKKKAEADMQAELKNILAQKIASAVPPGFVLIPGALAVSYRAAASAAGNANGATLTESGAAAAAIVKSADLAAAVAAAAVNGYAAGEPVGFIDPSHIPLIPLSSYSAATPTIDLSFSAPVTLVWQIDQSQVAQAVAGKKKSDFDSIMQAFKPAVAQATASIHPFWLSTFPSNPSKIKVIIKSGS